MLLAVDRFPPDTEPGELLVVVHVHAANVVRDLQENLRNLMGGRLGHYERLIQEAVEAALVELAEKARTRGYHGVAGVKIAHPNVVEGGVEVIVYGNGFRRKDQTVRPPDRPDPEA